MKRLWAITHIDRSGFRTFTHSNTGRHHHPSKEKAEDSLCAILKNNGAHRLADVFGPHFIQTARVDWVECHDHGDRMGGGKDSRGQLYFPEFDTVTKTKREKDVIAEVVNPNVEA